MKTLERILLPKELKEKFKLEKIEEKAGEWIANFVECEDQLPEAAKRARSNGEEIVLNGYQREIELTDFPLKDKICYFRFKRRRWKIKGTNESFENHYKLHPKGLKCTIAFGNFLKGLDRRSRHKFFITWSNIRYIREEDFSLVSRIKRVFNREGEAS